MQPSMNSFCHRFVTGVLSLGLFSFALSLPSMAEPSRKGKVTSASLKAASSKSQSSNSKPKPKVMVKVSVKSVVAPVRPVEQLATPTGRADGYTGVIIDARGLHLERSMAPSIRREDGAMVWRGDNAEEDFVLDEGVVAYARTLEDARAHARAGRAPLLLQAIARHNDTYRSDPILSEEDAEALLKFAARDGFLKKFRVIFVID